MSVTGWQDVGVVQLKAGKHQLSLRVVGSTQLQTYNAGLDAVRFTQLPPSS